MTLLDKCPNRHPRTASRVIDGEAVIVIPEENVVKILNNVGSRIWELANGTRSVREIAEVIYNEYEIDEAQAKNDAVGFIEELIQSQMMTL